MAPPPTPAGPLCGGWERNGKQLDINCINLVCGKKRPAGEGPRLAFPGPARLRCSMDGAGAAQVKMAGVAGKRGAGAPVAGC